MKADIMVPGHPRWCEFLNELSKAKCCARTTAHAERVLAAMPGINVQASLLALRELGGNCDCGILFGLVDFQVDRI